MMNHVTQHRTQIYLPQDLFRQVKVLAREKKVSLAHIMREAVASYTGGVKKQTDATFLSAKKALLKQSGMGAGPKDLAKHHDAYW